MSVTPYIGNPAPNLCEDLGETLLFRHISFTPGEEPQLFLTEQCLRKDWRQCPSIYAQCLERDTVWRKYLEEFMVTKSNDEVTK